MTTSARTLETLLDEYKSYTELFASTISKREVWEEQTGCEADDFFDYVTCCEARLFDFGTWYEHSYNLDYPTEPEFNEYSTFKFAVLPFHL